MINFLRTWQYVFADNSSRKLPLKYPLTFLQKLRCGLKSTTNWCKLTCHVISKKSIIGHFWCESALKRAGSLIHRHRSCLHKRRISPCICICSGLSCGRPQPCYISAGWSGHRNKRALSRLFQNRRSRGYIRKLICIGTYIRHAGSRQGESFKISDAHYQ